MGRPAILLAFGESFRAHDTTTSPGNVISVRRDSDRHFYHTDGLGGTVMLTDRSETGTVAYHCEVFGNAATIAGTTENPFQWAGQKQVDSDESERRWMQAREYHAGQGHSGNFSGWIIKCRIVS